MAFWPQNSHGKNPTIDELRARYAALFARFGDAPEGLGFTPGKLGAIPGEWVGVIVGAILASAAFALGYAE